MKERVLAIVSLLTQYVVEDREFSSEKEIIEELLAAGFEAEEIDAAFSWMENLSLDATDASADSFDLPPHRVFTREERQALPREARGFLTRLRMMGILDAELQEEVIARAVGDADGEVALRDVKTMTTLTLFARTCNNWNRELEHILKDDWAVLYH